MIEISSESGLFSEAYDVIRSGIAPEYLETEAFLHDRFRIQEQGPQTDEERLMVPDGYRLHLIAALDGGSIAGVICGSLIPRGGLNGVGIGFVSYLVVLTAFRRKGVGIALVEELARSINADARASTGTPASGMLFEIENTGKDPMQGLAKKLGARPMEIDYYQPSVREGYGAEQMELWYWQFGVDAQEEFSAASIEALVRNAFQYLYPGQDRKGFDMQSLPYRALLESLRGKETIGFK